MVALVFVFCEVLVFVLIVASQVFLVGGCWLLVVLVCVLC